jgi:hypothetical protein
MSGFLMDSCIFLKGGWVKVLAGSEREKEVRRGLK